MFTKAALFGTAAQSAGDLQTVHADGMLRLVCLFAVNGLERCVGVRFVVRVPVCRLPAACQSACVLLSVRPSVTSHQSVSVERRLLCQLPTLSVRLSVCMFSLC